MGHLEVLFTLRETINQLEPQLVHTPAVEDFSLDFKKYVNLLSYKMLYPNTNWKVTFYKEILVLPMTTTILKTAVTELRGSTLLQDTKKT